MRRVSLCLRIFTLLLSVFILAGCQPQALTEPGTSAPTVASATQPSTPAPTSTPAPSTSETAPVEPKGIILTVDDFVNESYLNPMLTPEQVREQTDFVESVDSFMDMMTFSNGMIEYQFGQYWEQGAKDPTPALAVVSYVDTGYSREEAFCGILIGDRFEETIARFRQDYDWTKREDGKFWGEGQYPDGGHYSISGSGDDLAMTLVPETVFPFAKIHFSKGRVIRVSVYYLPTV